MVNTAGVLQLTVEVESEHVQVIGRALHPGDPWSVGPVVSSSEAMRTLPERLLKHLGLLPGDLENGRFKMVFRNKIRNTRVELARCQQGSETERQSFHAYVY